MNYSPFFSVFLGVFVVIWTCNNFVSPISDADRQAYLAGQNNSAQDVAVISSELAAEGLDLKALPALIKETKDAKSLESKLNEVGGVNNLDLNNDGVVDYLKVDEFGEGAEYRGFSITTEVEEGQVQEVATIEVTKQDGDKVEVEARGNEQIYGRGYGYSGLYTLSSVLMWSYILSPHSFYRSPYSYGRYPSSYGAQRTASRTDYANRASRFEKTSQRSSAGGTSSTVNRARATSPNANKQATGIKKNLRQPTASQRSFQTRARSKSVGSGGFGKSSGKSRSLNSFFGGNRSVRGFSSSRRSGGFGGFGK